MLSSARQRSRSDACVLSDGTLLLASEWMKGENLRRVSLHRCVVTRKGFRCSGPVDIPLTQFAFGQSHPQLVCRGLSVPIKAGKSTRDSGRKPSPGPVSDVPARTPLLYIRHGHFARGLTRLNVYGVFFGDSAPGEQSAGLKEASKKSGKAETRDVKKILKDSGSIRVRKVAQVELPSMFDGKDMVATATRTNAGKIRLTVHEKVSGKNPHLWLLESKDGWFFPRAHSLFPGEDGVTARLDKNTLLAVYRRRPSPQSPHETYARIASQPGGPWSPPLRISTDLLHMGPPSMERRPDGSGFLIVASARHRTVGSNSLIAVELETGAERADDGDAESGRSREGSRTLRVVSRRILLKYTKERRLYAGTAQTCDVTPKDGVLVLYAQELKELMFELRGLLIPRKRKALTSGSADR